jgi:putative copper export protein
MQTRFKRSRLATLLFAAGTMTRRFSALSLLVVGGLTASGLTNSYFLVGDLRALVTTKYGRLLMLKLFLFFTMIGLGAYNRLRLKPQFISANDRNDQQRGALRKLMRNVIAELCLGMLIVFIVGALGATPHHAIACKKFENEPPKIGSNTREVLGNHRRQSK